MSTVLHLVGSNLALGRCLNRVGPCDSILIMYKDSISTDNRAKVAEASSIGLNLYLLEENLEVTTMPVQDPRLVRLDYVGFVALTERHETIVTWA